MLRGRAAVAVSRLLRRPTNLRFAAAASSCVDASLAAITAAAKDPTNALLSLTQCGLSPDPPLVTAALSQLRNDWSAAMAVFRWAQKQPDYAPSLRDFHSLISTLAKLRRFDTAWEVVEAMRAKKIVSPETILILVWRYCAVHDVANAVAAFHRMRRFGFEPRKEDFQVLLSGLSRHKNVRDAECLLFECANKYPLDTKGFNIVLNGYCNVVVRPSEAWRVWKSMETHKIARDAVSYGCMIGCYSKVGNLHAVLKMFDQMKAAGVSPDRKVYNGVVHALAKKKMFDNARALIEEMASNGIHANAVTFNSLIGQLCKDRRVDEAWKLLEEMRRRGLFPSARTFHAFFHLARSKEEVYRLFERMNEMRCKPGMDTFVMLIRKLCQWRQHENAYELWNEMIPKSGLTPDRSAYIVLIHGLFLSGRLEEAVRYYDEMKTKGFLPEPKTEHMIKAYIASKTPMLASPTSLDSF